MTKVTLPLNQIAISSIDLRRSEKWWREGLGFLPSGGTRLFRGKDLSNVSGLPNAAATVRWLVGQDEWLQIELWQYENPVPRLMKPDYAPNHQGFSRCGVWVVDFDQTLKNLSSLGTHPLSEPQGEVGKRRVCVRDPDGVFVEIMERDPTENLLTQSSNYCSVAFRTITITTLDLNASINFATEGLGLQRSEKLLHQPDHESLWNLTGAKCKSAVFSSGPMLVEFVEYDAEFSISRSKDASLNDQGILNIAFGDKQNKKGVEALRQQAIEAGATPSTLLSSIMGGAVYMTDPQGVSFEFMWASPGLGHKLTGFLPSNTNLYAPTDNYQTERSTYIEATPEQVFSFLSDHNGMSEWAGIGKVEVIESAVLPTQGVGLQRLINTKIKEEITCWQPPYHMRYRIIDGGPFNNYIGEFTIKPDGEGSSIYCVNRFRSRVPGLGWLLKIVVGQFVSKVLKNMKQAVETSCKTLEGSLDEE